MEQKQKQKQKLKLKLYSFWWSSCSHRIRIALNFKELDYEYIPVNLVDGEQNSPEFRKLNPIGLVPVLVDGDIIISDSFAIFMYLDEKYPHRPLLPSDLQRKAINIQAANIVYSSIQPIQALAMKYFRENGGPTLDEQRDWVKSNVEIGFAALEKLLKDYPGIYATGDEVSMADLFLAPQIYAGIKRFSFDMSKYPLLSRLNETYIKIPAFVDAIPDNQPDTPPSYATQTTG
ncbi:hypothetical protein ACFE04_010408 [Oxalis oulophora]